MMPPKDIKHLCLAKDCVTEDGSTRWLTKIGLLGQVLDLDLVLLSQLVCCKLLLLFADVVGLKKC